MTRAFEGYHGTTREAADEILRTQYYRFSRDEEEWLGKGIYFFEDDLLQAQFFCTKARRYSSWVVLYSHIETDNYIDLTKTEHFEEFRKIALRVSSRYRRTAQGRLRTLLNGVILNIMYLARPFDLVRHTFPVPPGVAPERTSILHMQVQLCVRNRQCIQAVQEVNFGGH